MTQQQWAVGDICYIGMLVRNGRDDGDSATEPRRTLEEADADITASLGHLSAREQDDTLIAVRPYRVLSINDDGTVGDIESV